MNELTPEQAQRAREEFQRALDMAVPAYDIPQLLLFEDSEEEFIRKEVDRKLYEPKLPNGGDRERKILERLKKLASQKDWDGAWRAQLAIKKWQSVLPADPKNPGYYYVCSELKPTTDKDQYDWLQTLKTAAHRTRQWDKKWFAQLLLDGLPEPSADFFVECFYLLKCADGNISRQVQLTNVVGETTGKVLMDSTSFHAPKNFREWCLQRGAFNWGAGEKELQKLHLDIGRLAAWRTVNQVVTLGWYPLSREQKPSRTELKGIWFLGDCARIGDKWCTPDEDGIYWHRHSDKEGNLLENGYQVSADGRENPYLQKKPMFHPAARISTEAIELRPDEMISFEGWKGEENKELNLDSEKREELELKLYRAFFREMCNRLERMVGSKDAYFLIGSFLSFAAAPELFDEFTQFPGLWVHGEANSGKSTIVEWLMEIWGFRVLGINLKGTNSTAVGLLQAADQYCNLPVWGDEFRSNKEEVGKDKLAVLHNAFNRAGQAKFNPSGIQREMRTTFIVSGESTTSESAIRGRYPHIQISKHTRGGTAEEKGEDFNWFTKHRRYFFFFGRYIIEHREEFVANVQKFFERWGQEKIDPRLRITHGIGYVSWLAMVSMLETHGNDEVTAFKSHMISQSRLAEADVQSDLNVNVFIQDMIVAYNAGELPWKCFRVESTYKAHAPGKPGQMNWTSDVLFINPADTVAHVQMFLRKSNQNIVLNKNDLRDQLSKNKFFLQGDQIKRFRNGPSTVRAWGIEADFHPLGYREVEDDLVAESQKNMTKNGDPRKGPLYQLIESVKSKQLEEAQEGGAG